MSDSERKYLQVREFGYYYLGNLLWEDRPGGLPLLTEYDKGIKEKITIASDMMNRPYQIQVYKGNSMFWDSGNYHYDGVGNITSIRPQSGFLPGYGLFPQAGDMVEEVYHYDPLSRLINAGSSFGALVKNENTRGFTYDAFGNLLHNG